MQALVLGALLSTELAGGEAAFRMFVYDLPAHMNVGINPQRASNVPTWPELSEEKTIHQMLLKASWRTKDPHEADLFFVPVYPVAYCTAHPDVQLDPGMGCEVDTRVD